MSATAPPAHSQRRPSTRLRSKPAGKSSSGRPAAADDHEILFQKFFKSVGPRTYAAQVKRARNGNHYLVLMEGKRDESSEEIRKTRLFIYSEDFVEFFRLAKSAAEFIKANPLPDAVRRKREQFWSRQPSPALEQRQPPSSLPPKNTAMKPPPAGVGRSQSAAARNPIMARRG